MHNFILDLCYITGKLSTMLLILTLISEVNVGFIYVYHHVIKKETHTNFILINLYQTRPKKACQRLLNKNILKLT